MVPPPMIESQPDPSGAPLPSFAALSSTTPSAGTLGASTARHMRVRIGSPVRLYFQAGTKVTALQQRPLASLSAAVRALALAGSLQLKCAPPRVATSAHLVRVRLRDRVRVRVRARVRVRVRAHVLLRAVSEPQTCGRSRKGVFYTLYNHVRGNKSVTHSSPPPSHLVILTGPRDPRFDIKP